MTCEFCAPIAPKENKTRAIEISPGVFVAPEGYTGRVLMVDDERKGDEVTSWCVVYVEHREDPITLYASASSVAAGLVAAFQEAGLV